MKSLAHALCLAALLTATALPGCTTDSGAPLFVSEQQEQAVGKQVYQDILAEYGGACAEPECPAALQQTVTDIGRTLALRSARPTLPFTFTILHTDTINAFAAPGGYVFVTTGLIRKMSDKSELVGVIGHEVGHVALYHGANAIQRNAAANLLNDLLLGSDTAASDIAGAVFGGYEAFVQSPEQELEADTQGVLLSAEIGYTPNGLIAFFEVLQQLKAGRDPISAGLGRILSTHPPEDKRIAHAKAVMQDNGIDPDDPSLAVDGSPPFSQILAMLPPPKGDSGGDK